MNDVSKRKMLALSLISFNHQKEKSKLLNMINQQNCESIENRQSHVGFHSSESNEEDREYINANIIINQKRY